MAEERTLGQARAREVTGEEPSKEELQRRMEEARDSISHTVTEIKDTVVNQYQSVKDTISETLDWREQFRKRPLAWSAGALGLGFFVGYGIAAAVKGDGDDQEGHRLASMKRVSPAARSITPSDRYYAAQGADSSEDWGTTSTNATAAHEEPSGPGLFERFKETAAYDRLEREVSSLGDRFIDELSKTAVEVVLPMLLVKVSDLIGIDLSGKKQPKDDRLLAGKRGTETDREVYGARSGTASSAANRGDNAQPAKGDGGRIGSTTPRAGEVNA